MKAICTMWLSDNLKEILGFEGRIDIISIDETVVIAQVPRKSKTKGVRNSIMTLTVTLIEGSVSIRSDETIRFDNYEPRPFTKNEFIRLAPFAKLMGLEWDNRRISHINKDRDAWMGVASLSGKSLIENEVSTHVFRAGEIFIDLNLEGGAKIELLASLEAYRSDIPLNPVNLINELVRFESIAGNFVPYIFE